MIAWLIALWAASAPAQVLERGTIIDRVQCASDPEQTYALYLPSTYSADRQWSLVLAFHPAARGRVMVEKYPGRRRAVRLHRRRIQQLAKRSLRDLAGCRAGDEHRRRAGGSRSILGACILRGCREARVWRLASPSEQQHRRGHRVERRVSRQPAARQRAVRRSSALPGRRTSTTSRCGCSIASCRRRIFSPFSPGGHSCRQTASRSRRWNGWSCRRCSPDAAAATLR